MVQILNISPAKFKLHPHCSLSFLDDELNPDGNERLPVSPHPDANNCLARLQLLLHHDLINLLVVLLLALLVSVPPALPRVHLLRVAFHLLEDHFLLHLCFVDVLADSIEEVLQCADLFLGFISAYKDYLGVIVFFACLCIYVFLVEVHYLCDARRLEVGGFVDVVLLRRVLAKTWHDVLLIKGEAQDREGVLIVPDCFVVHDLQFLGLFL